MMKQLYLIRHSKSSWKNPKLTDKERPLNKRGKRDAPFMAKLLADQGMQVDALLASPSKRTAATAFAFAEALKISSEAIQWEETLYEASANTILHLVQGLSPNWQTVALFAHNYGLHRLCKLLCNAFYRECSDDRYRPSFVWDQSVEGHYSE